MGARYCLACSRACWPQEAPLSCRAPRDGGNIAPAVAAEISVIGLRAYAELDSRFSPGQTGRSPTARPRPDTAKLGDHRIALVKKREPFRIAWAQASGIGCVPANTLTSMSRVERGKWKLVIFMSTKAKRHPGVMKMSAYALQSRAAPTAFCGSSPAWLPPRRPRRGCSHHYDSRAAEALLLDSLQRR